MINELLDRFSGHAPIATMVRALFVNVLSNNEVDTIFRETAEVQRQGELLFSTAVGLLQLAVIKSKPSVLAAYKSRKEEV